MPPNSTKTWTLLSGHIIKETDAALLFQFKGTSHWFPLSQITEIHRDVEQELPGVDDTAEDSAPIYVSCDQIKVADWLLVKKGISL